MRPNGYPIDAKGFKQMLSYDVIQEKTEITKINWFVFLIKNILMCIYIVHSKCNFKGKPNDDLPTVTTIFKKVDNF